MSKNAVKARIEELSKEINAHNYSYYVLDKPVISDYDFDMILEELIPNPSRTFRSKSSMSSLL